MPFVARLGTFFAISESWVNLSSIAWLRLPALQGRSVCSIPLSLVCNKGQVVDTQMALL